MEGSGLIGRELGDFVLLEVIGRGGFGEVYRARQLSLNREAAVKVGLIATQQSDRFREAFLREAHLASRLDHPFAAHIYAFGHEPDGLLWIAMELVRGTPLDVFLERERMPVTQFAPLLERLCEVVQCAHEQGVIHRDIKASNVMVLARAGRLLPKLLDLGIAKLSSEAAASASALRPSPAPAPAPQELPTPQEQTLGTEGQTRVLPPPPATQAGTFHTSQASTTNDGGLRVGTPTYMAPEQWENSANVDARVDIYALAVLAYRAVSGRYPFQPASGDSIMLMHLNAPVPPLGASFPAALTPVLTKALAKEPRERYATAMEFAQAFRGAIEPTATVGELPKLDAVLSELWTTRGPQPIAEAVGQVDAARSANQLRQAVQLLTEAAAELLGIYALASRARVGPGTGDDPASNQSALQALRGKALSQEQWLELGTALCAPWRGISDAHPLPELVQLFAGTALARLVRGGQGSDGVPLERLLQDVEALLRSLGFLLEYRLCVRREEGADVLMGLRRARPAAERAPDELRPGQVFLLGAEGAVALVLWPLAQMLPATPGAPEELFLFQGASRFGSRLRARPHGFERYDDELEPWLLANGLSERTEEESGEGPSAQAPYRGLSSFTAADSANFFGREREAQAFANRLRILPLMAVVGPSGVGKSSFVQAGVVPLLEGAHVLTVRPGPNPLASLETRLRQEGIRLEGLRRELTANPRMLGRKLEEAAVARGGQVLLVVDQFEELLTLCADRAERLLYADALAQASYARNPRVRVILTLRDDFLIRAQGLPALREKLTPGLQLLSTPAPEDLRRVLVEPARRLGFEFQSPELPDEMVREVADVPGALALLSFTAAQLWALRDRQLRQLTRSAYTALGGVGGALAKHAEEVLSRMQPDEQPLVREAFRHLVTGEGTRAVLSRKEMAEVLGAGGAAERALSALIDARLLVSSEAVSGEDRVEVIHEALLTSWPRLVEWRREDAENVRMRDQLRAAGRQWEEHGRAQGLLWRGEVLVEYRLWRARYAGRLTLAEEQFVAASLRDEVRSRWLRRAALFAVMLVLAGTWASFRLKARRDLQAQLDENLGSARTELAEASKLEAAWATTRAEAMAAFDGQQLERGEQRWTEALALAKQWDARAARASNQLELAMRLDPTAHAPREAMNALLYERALRAEREGRAGARDELIDRLKVHDVDGTWASRWSAPATLQVETRPAGASVRIERFEDGGATRVRVVELAATPASSGPLPQGSYVLTLMAPGRALVSYPIVLGRSEAAKVELELPAANDVPPGFVYVAPGPSRFGHPGPEALRRFFAHIPEHAVTSKPYLIARNEVTYSDWLRYLESLPVAARAKLVGGQKSASGHAELTRLSNGAWQLSFQGGLQEYRALQGQPVTYLGRMRRATQDWLRFPVMGVSFTQAQDYARWLRESGGVASARLCTEVEWEKAARGADGRTWPHGERLVPQDANYDETYGKTPSAFGPDEIGSHPAGASPYGVEDLAGNIQEWTVGTLGDSGSVTRGGAFYYSSIILMTTNRTPLDPEIRENTIGLRICATPGSP